ncbi:MULTISPECIES: carbohydrate ABC transporter permease [Stappiaceae]|jgi:multiple sugar transport system permease protein|uniref:carbohydrate ABC transporter permease n=1 Tax=Stappiaceae TaxID=2821832 RepID=UPI001267C521|nr:MULTISPECIES: sugar ABC transporter permease [Stappiaceae]MBN8184320.1 sugar ABC transporter permease [Roseibium aggregatum]MBO6858586.1 sugar ABC transporter permease [Roseibium sp.]QFT01362.1 Inner membrane ABC transporter permease protein YcjO [Labrenzia sp. THAF191b]QFT08068.1 Inner membrane ABC transporter permease protein YcjO [Labrenzia sp. THAF191a]QFT19567.1 Inner membrane ABC transporter permease protein YcjO [Labrenzia sp. THAF187b]
MSVADLSGSRLTDAPVSAHARRGGLKAGEGRFGVLLLVPALCAFGLVVMWPFLQALAYSFFEYTLYTPEPVWVGIANFQKVLSDPGFWESLTVTAIYVVLTTFFSIVLGFAWALILNEPFRGRDVMRSISLLPWIMPSVVTAFLWGWIFNSRYGLLNYAAMSADLIDYPQAWLSTPSGAMAAVIVTKVWLSIPLFMAFFLAGLSSMDRQQIEAARVDGAGNFSVLKDHIIPHLRPVLLVVIVLAMIGNLQQFDTIWALTGGGPVRATTVLSVEVYRRAFEQWDIGMAATVGVLWVATILPPAYFYLRQLMKGAD